jgi:hypothetical protein
MSAIKTPQDAMRARIHECIASIRAHFRGAVRPIYGSNDRGLAVHIGSCTLLDVGGTRLVLTAAHVIDDSEFTNLYIAGGDKLVVLEADFMATTPPGGDRQKDRHDFAIAKLSPTTVTELGNVRYLSEPEILRRAMPTEGHCYVPLGYPSSKNKEIDHVNNVVPDVIWPYGGARS